MKVNRNSWHYRVRAWGLRVLGAKMLIEPQYGNVGMGEYIFDVIVVGMVGILITFLRWLGKLAGLAGDIKFHNDKEKK